MNETYDPVPDLARLLTAALHYSRPAGLSSGAGAAALARLRENLDLEPPVTADITAAAIRAALAQTEQQAAAGAAGLSRAWQELKDSRQRGELGPGQRHAARLRLLKAASGLTPAGKAGLPADMQSMLWNFQVSEQP
jgi:hypothetical protein